MAGVAERDDGGHEFMNDLAAELSVPGAVGAYTGEAILANGVDDLKARYVATVSRARMCIMRLLTDLHNDLAQVLSCMQYPRR